MATTRYSKIKKIIEENPHLKNKELAKKVGRSISWLKAFKAFMNAEDKYKYKNSSNGIYRAIFNAWLEDIEAQKEKEKDELYKSELQQKEEKDILHLEEEIEYLKKELSNLKKQYDLLKKNYQNLEQMKKEEIVKMANELCTDYQNKLEEKIKELEKELHCVYYIQDIEKEKTMHKLKVTLIIIFFILAIFFILFFFIK